MFLRLSFRLPHALNLISTSHYCMTPPRLYIPTHLTVDIAYLLNELTHSTRRTRDALLLHGMIVTQHHQTRHRLGIGLYFHITRSCRQLLSGKPALSYVHTRWLLVSPNMASLLVRLVSFSRPLAMFRNIYRLRVVSMLLPDTPFVNHQPL
jgi:hypothetical protein